MWPVPHDKLQNAVVHVTASRFKDSNGDRLLPARALSSVHT